MKRRGLHFNIMMVSVIALMAAILVISGCAQQTRQQQQQKQQTIEAPAVAPATEEAEQPAQMPLHPSQKDIYEDNLDQSLEELDQLD